MAESFWNRGDWTREPHGGEVLPLAQGDLLPKCRVPVIPDDFGASGDSGAEESEVELASADLIVLTQSCDLAQRKAPFVTLCRAFSLARYEELNPAFAAKGRWEEVRKGRREDLHMLGGHERPDDNRQAIIIDFRQIHSLPVGYLQRHAERLGDRDRLRSPYLEHFPQAFARFFMRVGLPASIPPFK